MKKLYFIILSRYWLAGIIFWVGWHSCLTANAQVSGFVFRDFNADGIRTDTLPIEPGVANITVRVFIDRRTQPVVKITGADGAYTFSAAEVPAGSLFRLEFVDLPTGYFPGPHGTTSKTTVQFGVAPAVDMDAGINYPADYCQANPPIVTPCYINGDPLKTKYDDGSDIPADNQAGRGDVLVSYPYTAQGVAMQGGTMPDHLASGAETGSLWGLVFQRRTNLVLSAAVIKRHAGLGPLGTGGIYQTNMATKVTKPFLNLQSLGINTGPDPHSGLLGDKLMANYDSVAMAAIGKSGIGGVAVSDDDKMLYFVNMHDKRVYGVFINSPARDFINSPITPTASDTISWKIPDPGCLGGEFRPWALKSYRGKLYVGGVCSAENSNPATPYADTSKLRGVIFRFDPAEGRVAQFTEVLSFPLSFTRGYADGTDSCIHFTSWLPWTNKFPKSCINNKHAMWPQPIISDLAFDVDGSLVIGMLDRFGFQSGRHNFAPTTNDNNKLYDGFSSGDMLRAYNNNGVFKLESNGNVGPLTGSGVNAGQGPGNGEFYGDDFWLLSSNGSLQKGHDEIFNGALTLVPGKGEVITSAYDPITDVFQSGGIRAVSNRNGISNRGYVLYSDSPGTFGKASGLGDVEALCDQAPIEIGNRVWYDDNRNGIQDAYEKGIPNLILTLHDMDNGGVQVGQTTTSSSGEYYFNDSNVTPKLLPKHRYQVRIDPQQLTAFTPNAGGRRAAALASLPQYYISPADQVDLYSNTAGINSKGRVIDAYFVIDVITTDVGENNHTLDLSVYSCPILTVDRDTLYTCDGESISSLTIIGQYFSRDDSVRVVYFDTPQSGTAVYAGGTIIGTYKPGVAGQIVVNNPNIPPSTGDKKYYIYAILQPVPNQTVCRPYAGSVLVVKPKLKVAASGGTLTCSLTALTLTSTVTKSDGSPAVDVLYKWTGPNGFTSNVANPVITLAGTYTIGVASAECPTSWAYTEVIVDENKTPPVLQATGAIKACASCTVTVTASAPNATFQWTGPNGFSTTAAQFTTNQEGDYSVKATGITNSCSVSLTIAVLPPVCPIVQLLTPSTTLCAGLPAPVLSATTTGQTVQFWVSATPLSASALYAGSATLLGTAAAINGIATLSTSALSTQNTTGQPEIRYIYVTVPSAATIGGGCLPASGTTLQVNPLPVSASIISASAEARSCSTCSTTLTAVVQPASAQLLWTGPNGFSSTALSPVVSEEGVYTLVATMSNSCTTIRTTATVTVVTKVITTTVVGICIRDTPYISYSVTAFNFVPAANSATLIFLKANGDTVQVIKNQPMTGQLLYPGAAVDANGNPTDWPGWKLVGDEWVREDDGLTPNIQFIVSINPVSSAVALYPPPSPICYAGPPVGLGDFVWKDYDKDGVQDAGEPGVPNVRVELYSVTGNGVRSQSAIETQLTDQNGKYLFDSLDSGAYQVRFVPSTFPAGCTLTVANQGDDKLDSDADAAGYSQVVILDLFDMFSSRPNRTVDAGLIFVPIPLSVCSGTLTTLTAVSSGTTVTFWVADSPLSVSAICNGAGRLLGTSTVSGGQASFSTTSFTTVAGASQPQTYYVYATSPLAATAGLPCKLVGESVVVVNPLPVSASIVSLSAEARSCSTCSTTLTAVVQPASAQLLWTGPNGFSSTALNPVVSAEGVYTLVATMSNSCTTLEAKATLTVLTKAISTTAFSVCIKDTPYISYSVTAINFVPAANSATLIFIKLNGDTAQVIRNQPLSGRILYPGAAIDANGDPIDWPGWKQVGDEWVREDDGLTPSVQFIVSINPVSNSLALYPPPSPLCIAGPPLALGDFVWKDLDKDGVQDAGEPGVPNVRVELYTVTGGVRSQSAIKAQLTDQTGKYLFDTLAAGDYQVRFVPATFPAGCTLTVANQGDDKLDSDADAAGYSQVVTLDPNDVVSPRPNRTIDAGLIFVPTQVTICSGAVTSLTASSTGQLVQFWASGSPLSFSAVCSGTATLLGTATVGLGGVATLSTTALTTQSNSGQPELYYIYATSPQSVTTGVPCKPTGELLVLVKPLPVSATIIEAFGGGIPCRGCSATIGAVVSPANVQISWTGPDNFTSTALEIEVAKAGFYTIVVSNSNTCATTRDIAEVEVSPLLEEPCPILTMLSGDVAICSGNSLSAVNVQTADLPVGSSIRFVIFDQVPGSVTAIYSSGTLVASVTPDVNGIATLTALNGLFVNTGTQPITRYIYATVSPEPFDELCRPFTRIAIQVLPTVKFNLDVVPPTCAGVVAQSNGQVLVSGFDPAYRYSVATQPGNLNTTYSSATPVPATGIIASQLTNPATALTYYVRLLAPGNCYLDKQVVLNPVNCLCGTPGCIPVLIKRIR